MQPLQVQGYTALIFTVEILKLFRFPHILDIFYQVLTTFSSPVSLWSIQDGVEADIVLPTVRHHYGIAYKAVLSSTTTLNGPANSTMLRRSRASMTLI